MILAIDPGLTGALAFYDPDVNYLKTVALPTQWRLVNKKKKTEIDLLSTAELILPWVDRITEVVLEMPTAMPGAGATSQFNFGKTCGQLEGLMRGLGFKMIFVHPSTWKAALDVPSDKRRSRTKAQQFFPLHAKMFERVDSEGQAEAAMLAYWRVHAPEKGKKVVMGFGTAPREKKKKVAQLAGRPKKFETFGTKKR